MTTHDPDDEYFDAGDELDAFDFPVPAVEDDSSALDTLPDYAVQDGGHDDLLDDVHHYASTESHDEEVDDTFGAVDPQDEEAEDRTPVVQVINAPGTVTVTAYLNGSVAQVDLDPRTTAMTETQLAEEIREVADVASKKATAVVHIGVVNMLVEQGMDFQEARGFVETNMPFATPQQAGDAEAALMARQSDHQ